MLFRIGEHCVFWVRDTCRNGDKCHLQHIPELKGQDPRCRTKPKKGYNRDCEYWLRGSCTKEDYCEYLRREEMYCWKIRDPNAKGMYPAPNHMIRLTIFDRQRSDVYLCFVQEGSSTEEISSAVGLFSPFPSWWTSINNYNSLLVSTANSW